MLTEIEKGLASELLNGLPVPELLLLAKTVTNGHFTASSKEEARDAILLHSNDAYELLNRKKITKGILFKYLHFKSVPCTNTEKNLLVDSVIRYWKTLTSQDQTTNISSTHFINKLPDINALSTRFCEWFFSLLNEDFLQQGGQTLTEDDFWSDAVALVSVKSCDSIIQHTAESSESCARLIRNVRTEFNLLFSPNLNPNGLRGKFDPHGVALVMVCGTLHQGAGQCVGIFEQVFCLIKDPLSSNNWKIKKTELRLTSDNRISGPPCLEQGDLTSTLMKQITPT